jgi:putative spermidine/putrescine transport system permease protein
MASVAVVFVLLAALIFGLIGRFGDLPKLLGALNPEER